MKKKGRRQGREGERESVRTEIHIEKEGRYIEKKVEETEEEE